MAEDEIRDPKELFARAKYLTDREVMAIFSAAASGAEGVTHEDLEKMIDEFDNIKLGTTVLAAMERGRLIPRWTSAGTVTYRNSSLSEKKCIMRAVEEWDKAAK